MKQGAGTDAAVDLEKLNETLTILEDEFSEICEYDNCEEVRTHLLLALVALQLKTSVSHTLPWPRRHHLENESSSTALASTMFQ